MRWGQFGPAEGAISRYEMGEILRAAAEGRAVNGDLEGAARQRAWARRVQFRDGWRGVRRHAAREEES